MDTLYPAERHRRPRIPAPATADPAAGRARRGPGLAGRRTGQPGRGRRDAAGHGWPGHATRLAAPCSATLRQRPLPRGHHHPAHARRAAQDIGDLAAEARALSDLAVIDLRQSRFQQAESKLRQALGLYRQTW